MWTDIITNIGGERGTATEALQAALGVPPLHQPRKQLNYNYWLKAIRDHNHTTLKTIKSYRYCMLIYILPELVKTEEKMDDR